MVREPLRWKLDLGARCDVASTEAAIRNAALGPVDHNWHPPDWLLPHQISAARRIAASLECFGGALLADAVGLGKTYVALAVAGRYRRATAVVPAALASQWGRVGARVGSTIAIVTHEGLSRGVPVPAADLIVVDEAHRFRNPKTRRYDRLARAVKQSRLLLLTATPVVNLPSDIVHLLRLFTSDSSFALTGMASMTRTLAKRDYGLLTRAVAVAVVARSAESIESLTKVIPRVRDGSVIRACSMKRETMSSLLDAVDLLEFPGALHSGDCALLRMHMLFRLASSVAAFRETVKRHLAYVDRALHSVLHGQALSRSYARRIFTSDEDLQLALGDIREPLPASALHRATLEAERDRLLTILRIVSNSNGRSPKSVALGRVLTARAERKTLVFTTAVATALDLARFLEWREVAVVGAGNAWIASGKIPVDEALSLFAPRARGEPDPRSSMRVATLVATDLASEGLDLQDADGVVHYDLPWTPLRLQQRVGRIARLGSEFRRSDVFWFAPAAALDERLCLEARITGKVRDQIGLNVPTTSSVGHARIVNQSLSERESLGRFSATSGRSGTCVAVVRGPENAVVAVHWVRGNTRVPELIALQERGKGVVTDFAGIHRVLRQLSKATNSDAVPPQSLVQRLLEILRERLAAGDCGQTNPTSRRLARKVLKRAYVAGKRREQRLLSALDEVLERLRRGLTIGAERSLEEVLSAKVSCRALAAWLDDQPRAGSAAATFEIVAALFGDGTAPERSDEGG